MSSSREPNHLINEKSPYLLQHAHNPVNWYPWGEEAFRRAKAEERPVFLSIGYSTCHWCHVMERESFSDEEVAQILNKDYIPVKVDREERPDIDTIYMEVCQLLTGSGGWPLTVIMTPDKIPFFAGTYFPKNSRGGRPGLIQILGEIKRMWDEDQKQLLNSGREILSSLKSGDREEKTGDISTDEITDAASRGYRHLQESFDPEYGGFGPPPKFPTPQRLFFLFRHTHLTGDKEAEEMACRTLDGMYRGGIYDHIGYGFARYSTDRRWLVPHFEKMLYDNALLSLVYTEGYQITEKKRYARITEEILAYLLRDMRDEGGGFYTAEDADSEGEEGRFYLWRPDEIRSILGDDLGDTFCRVYDITEEGNFEGRNIPNLLFSSIDKLELDSQFSAARDNLLKARRKRVHPFKDDKILTGWNGLAITALATAARALNRVEYGVEAEKTADFLWHNLRRDDGRLMARYRHGETDHPAYAPDYAFFIWGLIELYQTTFRPRHLKRALELNRQLLDLFWDEEKGGLYLYGQDAEQLITRPKEIHDGAMPSGNSVATLNFYRLARITGSPELEETSEKQIRAFLPQAKKTPSAHTFFLSAALFACAESQEIVITGSKNDPKTEKMIHILHQKFMPYSVTLSADTEEGELFDLIPFIENYRKPDPAAYICRNFSCQSPITDPAKLAEKLEEPAVKRVDV